MNDLIDRDHRDDDIRALLADARAAAPDPVPWNDVVERHDRRSARPWRGVWAVAAAVILVGLLGLVVALQLRGDPGDVPADTPPLPTEPTAPAPNPSVDPLADLGRNDLVVPTALPDGYEVVVAFAPSGSPGSNVIVGGDEVEDVYVSSIESGSADVSAGESVEIAGAVWSQWDVVDEVSGELTVTYLQRRAGSLLISVSSLGAPGDLVEIAGSLQPADPTELDELGIPTLSADAAFTTVASMGDVTLSANGVEGYYCIQVDGRSASCSVTAKPDSPVAEALTSNSSGSSMTGGVAEGNVARIEFVRPGGVSVVVEPTDLSGDFDDRFWIVEGPLTGDRAIITYDDGTTAIAERPFAGRPWSIVDEP